LLGLYWWSLASPAEEDSFAALDALLEAQFQNTDDDLEADYQALDAALKAASRRFSHEIEAVWGEGQVVLPGKSAWVDYSQNRKLRRKFDYENGFVQIERIFAGNADLDHAASEIEAAVQAVAADTDADLSRKDTVWQYAKQDLQQQAIATKSVADTATKVNSTLDSIRTPVLAALLDTPTSDVVLKTLKNATIPDSSKPGSAAAPEMTSQVQVESKSQSGKPEMTAAVVAVDKDHKKLMVTIPLRQGYLSSAAASYRPKVMIEATRQNLPPSLLYAIMETESHFNPRARSHIPAFGLMQLVPASGGVDAYQHLYGEKLVLGPDYFYNPDQNVELGAAYLNLLNTRYLRSINNDISRMYCVIAAYNTGPGNVARAFVNSKSVAVAAPEINKLSPEAVFKQLIDRLPYEETRYYLQKVTSARHKYREMDPLVQL